MFRVSVGFQEGATTVTVLSQTKASRPTLSIQMQQVETESLIVDIQDWLDQDWQGVPGVIDQTQQNPTSWSCQTEFPNLLQQFSSGKRKIEFQDWIVNTENEINLRASPEGKPHNMFNLQLCISNQWRNYLCFSVPCLLEITPFSFTIAYFVISGH